MKKTQEVLGLPIVSVLGGCEVGKVKDIVINADKGTVDYIISDSNLYVLNARVIPADCVLGVGKDALTIESEDVLTDISRVPEVISLLQRDVRVKDTGVLTKKGRSIGKIAEIFIDDDQGLRIAALQCIMSNNTSEIIPRESVITFGKNLIIVEDDVEDKFIDDVSELGIQEYTAAIIDSFPVLENAIDESSDANHEEDSDSGNFGADLFEQKQKEYLKGRKASKKISGMSGNVIIEDGEVITEEIIDKAKASGKLVELVMNNKG